jgi:hypothetical protein
MDNNDDDFVRNFDFSYSDTLLPSTPTIMNQEYIHEDDDPLVRMAIEESIKIWEQENKTKKEIEKFEKENEEKNKKKQEEEIQRTNKIREKLGLVISRLKTAFKDNEMANDVLKWIEWECTPTHLLQNFRPNTQHSIYELKNWIYKNLNPNMIKLLEETSFF